MILEGIHKNSKGIQLSYQIRLSLIVKVDVHNP